MTFSTDLFDGLITEREKIILILRYGLDGNKKHTYRMIAKKLYNKITGELGVAHSIPWQANKVTLRKLRHFRNYEIVKEFFELEEVKSDNTNKT